VYCAVLPTNSGQQVQQAPTLTQGTPAFFAYIDASDEDRSVVQLSRFNKLLQYRQRKTASMMPLANNIEYIDCGNVGAC